MYLALENAFYERQSKLKEIAGDDLVEVNEIADDSGKLQRIQARNEAHTRIISLLLEFAGAHAAFLFGDFWRQLEKNRYIKEITAERRLFLDMLKLYEIREIDLKKWRGEGVRLMDNIGEFDLDYCLTCCFEQDNTLHKVERITVEKTGERVICVINEQESILMDDLLFEVSKE